MLLMRIAVIMDNSSVLFQTFTNGTGMRIYSRKENIVHEVAY